MIEPWRDVHPEKRSALVIVPTITSVKRSPGLIDRLFRAAVGMVQLLVVDDASPDGTDEVRRISRNRSAVHVLEREAKLGLGTVYIAGFRWAMERDFSVVVEMDADLSHDPAAIPLLPESSRDADLVIGSRYVAGGTIPNWGWFRRILSRAGNLYARLLLGIDVRDSTSGYRAYRTATQNQLQLDSVRSEGMRSRSR